MERSSERGKPRLRFDRPRRLAWLFTIGILSGVTGCANSPLNDVDRDPLVDAPAWITQGCRTFWQHGAIGSETTSVTQERFLCAVGSAGPDRNTIAAEKTAVARARSAIARSVEVTIENLVEVEDRGDPAEDGALRSIIHQLTSVSLPACHVESLWRSKQGEIFALVSLEVATLKRAVRDHETRSNAPRKTGKTKKGAQKSR